MILKVEGLIYTLSFTPKLILYGPASTQKVIRETHRYAHRFTRFATREERITVVPNPEMLTQMMILNFTTTISFFQDSKNYDKNRDEDV